MSGKVGLFTGSFDPVTLGHVDLIKRASDLFETLYVGIFYNHAKKGYFPIEVRQSMLEEALADLPNVKVVTISDALAVEVAKTLGVTHLVRGLRNAKDLEYEASLAFYNQYLVDEIETLFLLTAPAYRYVSSSAVRELMHFNSPIADFVPESVVKEVERRREEKE